MYCKKCGSELKENAVFCTSCGSRVDEKKVQSFLGATNKRIIAALAVGVVILGGACFVLAGRGTTAGKDTAQIEQPELSLEEKIRNVFEPKELEQAKIELDTLKQENRNNPEFYLMFADVALEYDGANLAKTVLLEGFEITSDSRIMEKFIDVSVATMDNYSKESAIILELAEGLAEVTDNEAKMELAKKAYVYFNVLYR